MRRGCVVTALLACQHAWRPPPPPPPRAATGPTRTMKRAVTICVCVMTSFYLVGDGGWVGGWVGGRVGGRAGGWVGGWAGGWAGGWVDVCCGQASLAARPDRPNTPLPHTPTHNPTLENSWWRSAGMQRWATTPPTTSLPASPAPRCGRVGGAGGQVRQRGPLAPAGGDDAPPPTHTHPSSPAVTQLGDRPCKRDGAHPHAACLPGKVPPLPPPPSCSCPPPARTACPPRPADALGRVPSTPPPTPIPPSPPSPTRCMPGLLTALLLLCRASRGAPAMVPTHPAGARGVGGRGGAGQGGARGCGPCMGPPS